VTDVVHDPTLPAANQGLASLDVLAAQVLSLDPPPRSERKALLRDEAGLLLDGLLVRVARGRGALDVAIGEGLAALAAGDRALRLGYSGIGDYARERLGIAGRTAQGMARLARELRDRPLLREAVRRGEVTARKAETVLPSARGEAEEGWVARARAETVRALGAAVRTGGGPADGGADEEPWDRIFFPLSAEERAEVDSAMALAGKVLGAAAPKWQRLEVICQEFLAAHPLDPDEGEDDGPSPLGDPVDDWLEGAKAALEEETRQWEFLPEPAAVAAPEDGLAAAADSDPWRLDGELRRLAAMRERWDHLVGHAAMLVKATGLWKDMCFATFRHYCEERLGMSARAVEQRAWLARRLCFLPALREALRAGRLSYEQARLVASVADDTTAEAWIVRAERTTCIALRREIEASEDRQMCARGELALRVPRGVHQLLWAAIRAVRASSDGWIGPGACLARIAGHFVETWAPLLRERNTLPHRVLERDRGFCQVPGCSRPAVHAHHVVYRSRGGGDEEGNLASFCAAHHLHGVHAGYVRVRGIAPDALTWELGVRPGAEPLVTVFGGQVVRA
jgi:hypothetical protein